MKNARMGSKQSHGDNKPSEKEVEVLYQKMGDRWFAFSLIDDEVFVGSIPQSEIDETLKSRKKSKKLAGNS